MTLLSRHRGFRKLEPLPLSVLLCITFLAPFAAAETARSYAVILKENPVGGLVPKNLMGAKGRVLTGSKAYGELTRRLIARQEPVKNRDLGRRRKGHQLVLPHDQRRIHSRHASPGRTDSATRRGEEGRPHAAFQEVAQRGR